jgi:hypothetical protein
METCSEPGHGVNLLSGLLASSESSGSLLIHLGPATKPIKLSIPYVTLGRESKKENQGNYNFDDDGTNLSWQRKQ